MPAATYFTASGVNFSIEADVDTLFDDDSYLLLKTAVDTHDHSSGYGTGVKRLQTGSAPSASGEVQVTGHAFKYWDATAASVRALTLSGDVTTAAAFTTSGAYSLTLTATGATNVTLPTTGTLATLAGSETFTNKTLTTPVIAQISNTGTLTLPTSTDTLVGRATTDTLTNKTLTSPTINGGTHTAITSLGVRSTGAAFDLTIASTEVFTAGRTLTVTLNDAARTLNMGGNITTAAAFVTSGAFSLTLTATGATNVTLPTTGTLATLAGTEEFTNKTLNASVGKGTWTASGTWTLPAHTLGGTVSGGGNQINNVIIGALTPLAGSFTSVTFSTNAISTTALATPSALSATQFTGFASTVSGASLMGYGTTNDVTLMNRAGTVVLGVTANTTGVTMAGALAITGALTGVTTLTTSGAINSQTISSAANFTGTMAIADTLTVAEGKGITITGASNKSEAFYSAGGGVSFFYNGTLAEATLGANYYDNSSSSYNPTGASYGSFVLDMRASTTDASSITAFKYRNASAGTTAFSTVWSITNAGAVTQAGGLTVSAGAVGIQIGGSAARGTTEPTNAINIFNGTAPVGTLTNGATFYAASGEMRVMDAAGNSTLLSPHDHKTNEWIFLSRNPFGKTLRIDMERLMRRLDEMFGGGFIHEFQEA